MNPLLILISLVLVVIGISIAARPKRVGSAIADFYRNYPLVRHAAAEQFMIKPIYVVMLGLAILATGIIAFVLVVT
jgi:hypothetical protein